MYIKGTVLSAKHAVKGKCNTCSQGLVLFLGILCYLSEELTNDTLLRFMCWAQLAGYQTDLMDGKGGQTASPSDFSGNQSRCSSRCQVPTRRVLT
ncbi:hypothetical protein ABBQ38_007870 [Trebouxia sp. C0009 RCD-2024]